MSALPPEGLVDSAAPPPAAAARPLSPWITGACVGVLAALIALLVLARPSGPLDRLDHPADSLELLTTRQLDLRDVLTRTSVAERVAAAALGVFDEDLDPSIKAYEELVAADPPPAPEDELNLAVLLGEAGRGGEARARAASLAASGGDGALYARWTRAAYGYAAPTPAESAEAVAEIREHLDPSWFSDALAARIAGRAGDEAARADAAAAIADRGRSLLWRWRALTLAQCALVVAGLLALRRYWVRAERIGGALLPPPWPSRDGYALLARGAVAFLVIGWLPAGFLGRPDIATVVGLGAGVPALLWTAHYLSARGISPWDAFGLRVPRARLGAVVAVALALVALGTVGESAFAFALDLAGWHTHWADGLPEDLLWERWWLVGVDTLDTAAWTPVVEEVMFRGVLYGALRVRLAVAPAALASGLLFAVAHGYGLAGFGSVLWSGVIWALAYERTRSLWPGIAAHAVNNLIVNVTLLSLLRI